MQFGNEATYGAAGTVTKRLGFISDKVKAEFGRVKDQTLDNSVSRKAILQGGTVVKGDIETTWDYHGQLLLLDGLFGTVSYGSLGGVSTGSNPYVHTFIERPLLNSLTFELIRGDVPAGKCYQVLGAKINGLTIRGAASRAGDELLCRATWNILAQDMISNATPTTAGTPTAPSRLPALFQEITTKDDGTADAAGDVMLKSMELSIQNNLDEARHEGGTVLFREPLRSDFVSVVLKLRKEYQTKTLFDAARAGTEGSPKLIFGSTTSKRLTLDIGSAQIIDYSDGVSDYGVQFQEVAWEAIYNAANLSALKMIVENTQALITT